MQYGDDRDNYNLYRDANIKLREEIAELQRAVGELRHQLRERDRVADASDIHKKCREEINDLRQIRETCIKALMVATGQPREMIEAKPFECAYYTERKLEHFQGLIDQHAQMHADNIMTMERMVREGAMIIYALDRALQLTELFMSCWPVNTPMHPGVATAKQVLDEAMAKVAARKEIKP